MCNKISGHLDKYKFLGKTNMSSVEFCDVDVLVFFVTKSSDMKIRIL